jgi:hypothetical protein
VFISTLLSKTILEQKEIILTTVNKNFATIAIGNLKVGQSGIIIHNTQNSSLIIANAIVQSTSLNKSTLILSESDILLQSALPTSNQKAKIGDIFVLNHMYHSSLLIVPNYEASKKIKELYPNQKFLNPDIFAAHLKITSLPVPTFRDIQKFCKSYNIGTIFIVVNNQLYIIDTNSLYTLQTTKLDIADKTMQSPFFTKITDIKTNILDFGADKIKDYNDFYLGLINNPNAIKTSIFPW